MFQHLNQVLWGYLYYFVRVQSKTSVGHQLGNAYMCKKRCRKSMIKPRKLQPSKSYAAMQTLVVCLNLHLLYSEEVGSALSATKTNYTKVVCFEGLYIDLCIITIVLLKEYTREDW